MKVYIFTSVYGDASCCLDQADIWQNDELRLIKISYIWQNLIGTIYAKEKLGVAAYGEYLYLSLQMHQSRHLLLSGQS